MYIYIYIYTKISLRAWEIWERPGSVRGSGMSGNPEKSGKSEKSVNSENTNIYRSGAPSGAAPEAEFPGLESSGSFENMLLTGPESLEIFEYTQYTGSKPLGRRKRSANMFRRIAHFPQSSAPPAPVHVYARVHTSIYIYIYIYNLTPHSLSNPLQLPFPIALQSPHFR